MKEHYFNLTEMVEHELCYSYSPPLRVSEDEGDVGLAVRNVRNHEGEGHDDATVDNDATEVGILQAFGD